MQSIIDLLRHLKHLFPVMLGMLRRHRLFVVFPVFLLLLTLSVQGERMRASVSRAGNVQETLTQGSLLAASEGIVEVHAGDFSLLGWAGGFSVTVEKGTVSVAALTTPVLIRGPTGRMLVPVRAQWKGEHLPAYSGDAAAWLAPRSLKALPPAYIEEHITMLRALPSRSMVESSAQEENISNLLSFLRLPAARTRLTGERSAKEVVSLASLLEAGRKEELLSRIQQADAVQLLASPEAEPLLPILLKDAAEQGMALWFLPAFVRDEDRLLLASLHPLLTATTWASAFPVVPSPEGVLLRVLMMPVADVLPEGFGNLAIDHWGSTLRTFLLEQDHPENVLRDLLPMLHASLRHYPDLGYPERAKHYADVLLRAIAPWRFHLEGLSLLVDLEAMAHHPLPPKIMGTMSASSARSSPAASAASSISSVSLLSDEDIRTHAEAALQGVGALFTAQTQIVRIDGKNATRVTSIAFPTPQGDRLVAFSYDVERDVVFDASQDGRPLPYDVPLRSYIEWLQRF